MSPTLQILIPPLLAERLAQNKELEASVHHGYRSIENWLRTVGAELPLFPEYTDHGIRHINNVLAGFDSLVTKNSVPLITSSDAAIYVVAVILHDLAMHISPDGFLDLISRRSPSMRVDALSWADEWETYYDSARRWDGQKLDSILGGNETEGNLSRYIRRPKEMGDPDDWPPRYRKFIGEFIRQHHGRLAHEVAHTGFPGPMLEKLAITPLDRNIADLAGLVARSHTMNLRDTFEYLEKTYYGKTICANAHPIYLMVLLRIADFLDVDHARTEASVLKVRALRNAISRLEWSKHFAINEVRPDEKDKEAIYVVARPENSSTFVGLRKLITALQSELDTSWAVLGEVYSKQSDLRLDQLGINLRRVKSNLDDVSRFAASAQFIPVEAHFGSSDTNLLKLLIEPLYGKRPEIGIRELLQNSVDAVLEHREYNRIQEITSDSEIKLLEKYPDADIVVRLDQQSDKSSREPSYFVEILDRGIGMSYEVICNYFLKAGASFRTSEYWRRTFLDNDKKAVIPRSGRFGIGVFAAFLLGNQMTLRSKNVNTNYAISFTAGLDDSNINLVKDESDWIGTRIRINLQQDVYHYLKDNPSKWDWYCSEDPIIVRLAGNNRLQQRHSIPCLREDDRKGWRSCSHSCYSKVLWTDLSQAPELCCNSIVIKGKARNRQVFSCRTDASVDIIVPRLNIIDPDCELPLNIARNDLQSDVITIDQEICDDVIKDFHGYCLATAPLQRLTNGATGHEYECFGYSGFSSQPSTALQLNFSCWVSTKHGSVYLLPRYLIEAGIQTLVLVSKWKNEDYNDEWTGFPSDIEENGFGVLPILEPGDGNFLGPLIHGWMGLKNLSRYLPLEGYRVFVHNDYLKEARSARSQTSDSIRPISAGASWRCYESGKVNQNASYAKLLDTNRFEKRPSRTPYLVELYLNSNEKAYPSRIWSSLKRMDIDPVIPYRLEDRSRKFGRAYEKLAKYLKNW